jgi:hypothetical protein
MRDIEWYKAKYPSDQKITYNDGVVSLPIWMCMFLYKLSGVRSKKKRIMKKVIKRTLAKILRDQILIQGAIANDQQRT